MYLVSYTQGEYDDFEEQRLFVTHNLEIAKSYCDKFNRILNKYKPLCEKIVKDIFNSETLDYDNLPVNYYRINTISQINSCYYEKIKVVYNYKN